MDREQLKKWLKIIAFFVAIAFAGLLIAGIIDSTGFVMNNFTKPIFFIIPLCFIVSIIILYVIYMFVEKGEALRIIANVLACVLVFYGVSVVTVSKRSDMINRYRYIELDSSAYQIVNSIFEDSTIEKDDEYFNPDSQSIGDRLVYSSGSKSYIINTDDRRTLCQIGLCCADNYVLGINRIVKDFKEKRFDDVAEWNSRDELVFEDCGSGEFDGINYQWAYGEFWDDYTERTYTEFIIMMTYGDSVYYATASFHWDYVSIDMENDIEKIVDILKSTDIFVDYK